MTTESKLNGVEDSLKEKYSGIIKDFSHVELKRFQKHEYKMKVLEYITALMPTFNKARLDETAQCVSNFLQREGQDLLRRKPRDSQTNNTNLLSETVINDLNSTIEPPENETTIDAIDQYDSDTHISDENEDNDEQVTTILDNSITQLKKIACAESKNSKTTEKNTHKSASYENNDTKCCKT